MLNNYVFGANTTSSPPPPWGIPYDPASNSGLKPFNHMYAAGLTGKYTIRLYSDPSRVPMLTDQFDYIGPLMMPWGTTESAGYLSHSGKIQMLMFDQHIHTTDVDMAEEAVLPVTSAGKLFKNHAKPLRYF